MATQEVGGYLDTTEENSPKLNRKDLNKADDLLSSPAVTYDNAVNLFDNIDNTRAFISPKLEKLNKTKNLRHLLFSGSHKHKKTFTAILKSLVKDDPTSKIVAEDYRNLLLLMIRDQGRRKWLFNSGTMQKILECDISVFLNDAEMKSEEPNESHIKQHLDLLKKAAVEILIAEDGEYARNKITTSNRKKIRYTPMVVKNIFAEANDEDSSIKTLHFFARAQNRFHALLASQVLHDSENTFLHGNPDLLAKVLFYPSRKIMDKLLKYSYWSHFYNQNYSLRTYANIIRCIGNEIDHGFQDAPSPWYINWYKKLANWFQGFLQVKLKLTRSTNKRQPLYQHFMEAFAHPEQIDSISAEKHLQMLKDILTSKNAAGKVFTSSVLEKMFNKENYSKEYAKLIFANKNLRENAELLRVYNRKYKPLGEALDEVRKSHIEKKVLIESKNSKPESSPSAPIDITMDYQERLQKSYTDLQKLQDTNHQFKSVTTEDTIGQDSIPVADEKQEELAKEQEQIIAQQQLLAREQEELKQKEQILSRRSQEIAAKEQEVATQLLSLASEKDNIEQMKTSLRRELALAQHKQEAAETLRKNAEQMRTTTEDLQRAVQAKQQSLTARLKQFDKTAHQAAELNKSQHEALTRQLEIAESSRLITSQQLQDALTKQEEVTNQKQELEQQLQETKKQLEEQKAISHELQAKIQESEKRLEDVLENLSNLTDNVDQTLSEDDGNRIQFIVNGNEQQSLELSSENVNGSEADSADDPNAQYILRGPGTPMKLAPGGLRYFSRRDLLVPYTPKVSEHANSSSTLEIADPAASDVASPTPSSELAGSGSSTPTTPVLSVSDEANNEHTAGKPYFTTKPTLDANDRFTLFGSSPSPSPRKNLLPELMQPQGTPRKKI